ncbi:hypothetical protein BDZ85DRAFT_315118 [Elsinoe ampelina]|uniref:Uncharacterized protein n=1 Tax=Elsinoe ampelina TaxID=302913 RepID=A0A6A6GPY1_9PEZI|nr:hypothetical protein BDZ85DRAFT_315118 [Elsinoe ampelina]
MESMAAPLLEQDVVQFFTAQGLLSPVQDKQRVLSASTLSSPRTLSEGSSGGSSDRITNASFTASTLYSPVSDIVIPDHKFSAESYQFLGFTRAKSDHLFKLFSDQMPGDDFPSSFLHIAIWEVNHPQIQDAYSPTDDWAACIDSIGIADELKSAIMDPRFDDVKFTASCKFWVQESVEAAYDTLCSLNEDLKSRQSQIMRARPVGRRHAGSVSSLPSQNSPSSKKLAPAGQASRDTKEQDNKSASLVDETITQAEELGVPSHLEGHTMLWTAGVKEKLERFYDTGTRKVSLRALAMAPGDFSGQIKVAYFTPQLVTADRYAVWLKHRVQKAEIAVAQIAVPNVFIEGLSKAHLMYSDTRDGDPWKQLVWSSRRADEAYPKALSYLYNTDLLIGHIAKGTDVPFITMDSWEAVGEQHVLIVREWTKEVSSREGQRVEEDVLKDVRALQWVFRTTSAREEFERVGSGKVWIHYIGRSYPVAAPVTSNTE